LRTYGSEAASLRCDWKEDMRRRRSEQGAGGNLPALLEKTLSHKKPRTSMNTELNSDSLLKGRLFDVVLRRFERPDGRRYVRQVVVHPGSVGIVAYDDQSVYLVRQPR